MLWMIGLALLASYYISEAAFQTVAVLSLVIVAISIVVTVIGLRSARARELV